MIKRRQVVLVQAQVQCSSVFAHMRLAFRLWNGDDALLPHEPGKRHLGRRRVVADRDIHELAGAEELPLIQRRIGNDRDMAPATPRHQCVFNTATLDVVHDLVRSHPCAGTRADEFLHIGEIEIAHAPVAYLAGTPELAECLQGLEKRNFLPPVQEIEVEPIRLEPSQAALARCNRAATCGVLRQNFADQKYLVTPPSDCLRSTLSAPPSAYISAVSISVIPSSMPNRSDATSSFRRRASTPMVQAQHGQGLAGGQASDGNRPWHI